MNFILKFFDELQFNNGTVLATILLAILVFWRLTTIDRRNQPPRAFGVPIFGYLPFVADHSFLTLDLLGKKYGGVFRMKLGVKEVVVLADFKAIQEAFLKQAFLGRPVNNALQTKNIVSGFVDLSGEEWKQQRQYTLKVLHKMGFGNSKMEDSLKNEVTNFIERVLIQDGRPFDFRILLRSSVANNISAFVYGKGLDYNDPKRIAINECMSHLTTNVRQISPIVFLPWLVKVLPWIYHQRSNCQYREAAAAIFRNDIREHEQQLDEQNPIGYIDEYLTEIRKTEDKKDSFTLARLVGNIQLLFMAGVETVMTTMEWCCVAMANHPDIQSRVQAEIDSVIGKYGTISWADRSKLPYTEAILMEVQRWRTVFPLSIFRRTVDHTTVQGFEIPKDTVVIANLWSAHNDPSLWPEPSQFRPERFQSADGTTIVKKEAFVPFSYGKRSCPGEFFAMMELFFYFVHLMKNFSISGHLGRKVNEDGILAVSFKPIVHEFYFKPRK